MKGMRYEDSNDRPTFCLSFIRRVPAQRPHECISGRDVQGGTQRLPGDGPGQVERIRSSVRRSRSAAEGLPEPDRERLKTDITELRDRKDALQHKFKDLKGVSIESWRDLKASMDRGLDQLELAYNVVAAHNLGGQPVQPEQNR